MESNIFSVKKKKKKNTDKPLYEVYKHMKRAKCVVCRLCFTFRNFPTATESTANCSGCLAIFLSAAKIFYLQYTSNLLLFWGGLKNDGYVEVKPRNASFVKICFSLELIIRIEQTEHFNLVLFRFKCCSHIYKDNLCMLNERKLTNVT